MKFSDIAVWSIWIWSIFVFSLGIVDYLSWSQAAASLALMAVNIGAVSHLYD